MAGILGGLGLGGIYIIDLYMGGGDRALFVEGLLDEWAHIATTFILLGVFSVTRRDFWIGATAGSVVIDLDHVPLFLGSDILTSETNRPCSHSLAVIIIASIGAAFGPSAQRGICSGITFGLAAHLFRDMATGTAGVPLLWPVSTQPVLIPYSSYMAVLVLSVGLMMARWLASFSIARSGIAKE